MARLTIFIVTAAALALTSTAHAAGAPRLKVHAIFAGDAKPGAFYGGQPVMATVSRLGKARVTRICWSRGPIESAKCTPDAVAFSPGKVTVSATLSVGRTLKKTITIRKASMGKPKPVDESAPPALYYAVTCDTQLFGNYDRETNDLRDEESTMLEGTHVAVYYRAGDGVLQVWTYGAKKAGFAKDGCLKPAAAQLNGG